ncbi:MAG: hypothetical protein A2Z89_05480 [Deltaproteobacteria bacterium GWA2_43_19]|nr:MAG: hypothetical protein A2Z89_05480 [Deltaproteobacteria bacterium GWA2_43_19]
MLDRKELLTDLLTLFTGEPLAAKLLIGRQNKNAIYVHIDTSFVTGGPKCPSNYTGHAAIRDKTFKPVSSIIMKRTDEIILSQKECRHRTILSYFKALYTQYYREFKIAFCYQLMESLSKLKGSSLRNTHKKNILKEILDKNAKGLCSTCISIINNVINKNTVAQNSSFDKYIEKAIDVINKAIKKSGADDSFIFQAEHLLKMAKHYRNEVFHGGYFKNVQKVKKLMEIIPTNYRRDIPVVMQAMVSILGAHIILGIEFNQMMARKRKTHE